jgi:hypothetical protein
VELVDHDLTAVAAATCRDLAPLLGSDPIPIGAASAESGGVHIAVVAVLVRIRGAARVRTATGVADDRDGALRSAVLEALRDPDLVEQAFERLVEEGALEAAIVRWGTRPLTFAGDADVDLRLIALFDLTLADVLLPGDRLGLCTDRYAYRLLGGRPAVALAAKPGPAAASLDALLTLIDELVSQPVPGESVRAGPNPQAADVAASVGQALSEQVRWLRLEQGGAVDETGAEDPCAAADQP